MEIKTIAELSSEIVVLHLDDIPSILKDMENTLKKLKFPGKILQAQSVVEALEICNTNHIDIIISDWNLPESSGLEFLTEIRAKKENDDILFIMCSTVNEVMNMLKAVTAGANDYIVKPWKIKDVDKKITLTWNMADKRKG